MRIQSYFILVAGVLAFCQGKKVLSCEEYIEGQPDTFCHTQTDVDGITYIYSAHFDMLDQAGAEASCQAKGGHLLSLRDSATSEYMAVNTFVDGFVTGVSAFYTGLKQMTGVYSNEDGTDADDTSIGAQVMTPDECITFVPNQAVMDLLGNDCMASLPYICEAVYYENKIVFVSNDQLTYPVAKETCQNKSGHLVTIENRPELDIINRLLVDRSIPEAWSGLEYVNETMKYKWCDGSYDVYRKWCAGQPDLEDVASAALPTTSTGCMRSTDQADAKHYMCEVRERNCNSRYGVTDFTRVLLKEVSAISQNCRKCRKINGFH